MTALLTSTYKVSDNVVARKIAGELVIIPLASGIGDIEDDLFSLNQTGEAIWEYLNGDGSVQEIVVSLVDKYDAPAAKIEEDVMGILTALLERGLVVEV